MADSSPSEAEGRSQEAVQDAPEDGPSESKRPRLDVEGQTSSPQSKLADEETKEAQEPRDPGKKQ